MDLIFKVDQGYVFIEYQSNRMYRVEICDNYRVDSVNYPDISCTTNTLFLRGDNGSEDYKSLIQPKCHKKKIDILINCIYELVIRDYYIGVKIQNKIYKIDKRKLEKLVIEDVINLNPEEIFIQIIERSSICKI